MKKISISAITNAILTAATVFFILCYPFSKILPRALTMVFSALIALLAGAAVYGASLKKTRRSLFRSEEKNAFYQRMHALYMCTDDEIQEIFCSLFNRLNICANVSGRHMRLNGGETLIAALLPEQMSANDLAVILRDPSLKSKKTTVVSSSFSQGAVSLARSTGVDLIDGDVLGKLLEKNELLPKPAPLSAKPSLREKIAPVFYKANGKRMLFYAAVLGAFSYFSFYPVYYVASSAFFAVFGLIALFFGKIGATAHGGGSLEELLSGGKTPAMQKPAG